MYINIRALEIWRRWTDSNEIKLNRKRGWGKRTVFWNNNEAEGSNNETKEEKKKRNVASGRRRTARRTATGKSRGRLAVPPRGRRGLVSSRSRGGSHVSPHSLCSHLAENVLLWWRGRIVIRALGTWCSLRKVPPLENELHTRWRGGHARSRGDPGAGACRRESQQLDRPCRGNGWKKREGETLSSSIRRASSRARRRATKGERRLFPAGAKRDEHPLRVVSFETRGDHSLWRKISSSSSRDIKTPRSRAWLRSRWM